VVKPIVTIGCGLVFAALIALDYFSIFSLSKISSSMFGAVLEHPWWILAPVAMVAGIYLLNYRFLMFHSYPEEINCTVKKKQVATQTFGFMSRFGLVGELIALELKLILRHKRTKLLLITSPIFLLYGLLTYSNPKYSDNMIWMVFTGIFVIGYMAIGYGQYLIAWESKFFDGILTREGRLLDYFRAKYYMLASLSIFSFVITSPYVFFGIRILWTHTACLLFNLGINALLLLWFALYNRKRIELLQRTANNWQGTGISHFILLLPAMLLPMLIASVFSWVGLGDWGLSVLAVIGVIGIIYHKRILQLIYRNFLQTKYKQAEGFRKAD
jgi:hypothetical protein